MAFILLSGSGDIMKQITVIGGDSRLKTAAEILKSDGFTVNFTDSYTEKEAAACSHHKELKNRFCTPCKKGGLAKRYRKAYKKRDPYFNLQLYV